ncbi:MULTISPECIES: MarR family winged helix-turn-helix transcriptional regulator [Nocardiaceae]|uniref:MarR family transcriptional regulator n=1 Tax=Rhodococcoides yunnanense TaxID=278209 RepID=A0ABU4BCT6_9NOCA|nr:MULTISPECIES: MarR family transcriptional regulator [Rhodococcus]MDI9895623.1 MarR family transcriptional regulator [Rhodococcus sp. IEGM 1381]MDV6262018.1 MarR family transcriptional regulator [Rhodococcus yunnanensis]
MEPGQSTNLSESFMAVARRIRRSHMSALEPFGLNPSQSRALHVLAREQESMRLRDLAEHLRIVARSATDIVDSLEAAQLVTRQPDPSDRRAVLVTLTDTGRALLDRIDDARRQVSSEMFDGLESAERVELNRLLAKIAESD